MKNEHSEPLSLHQVLNTIDFSAVFMPPRRDAPRQTIPAGSRDEKRCNGDKTLIRPVVSESNYSLTFAARPTIFVEMPETKAEQVLLVLQNEISGERMETMLPITEIDENGIAKFQLPEDQPSLAIGQDYQWFLAVICQNSLQPSDPLFTGWVQRVAFSTEVAQMLDSFSPAQQVTWFAERGHWQDMISVLLQHPDAFN
ncbi:MAG: DUF928 domain-containing protein [Phormidesmis sp. RL_2_1]|nr:DUF928 domain-containing protein [Phormidesmis sp. RL_2_1]